MSLQVSDEWLFINYVRSVSQYPGNTFGDMDEAYRRRREGSCISPC